MKSDNLRQISPDDPRFIEQPLSHEQRAILENCERIIALEKRIELIERQVGLRCVK